MQNISKNREWGVKACHKVIKIKLGEATENKIDDEEEEFNAGKLFIDNISVLWNRKYSLSNMQIIDVAESANWNILMTVVKNIIYDDVNKVNQRSPTPFKLLTFTLRCENKNLQYPSKKY